MDFGADDDLAAHRDAARAWADRNVRPEWAGEQELTGCHQTPELHRRLLRVPGRRGRLNLESAVIDSASVRALTDTSRPRPDAAGR